MTPPHGRRSVAGVLWQRRTTNALQDILATREDLTPIAWQIEPRGCVLGGMIDGPDRYIVERTFAEWQVSLGLTVTESTPDVLRAARTRRDRVRIHLVALLPAPASREDRP